MHLFMSSLIELLVPQSTKHACALLNVLSTVFALQLLEVFSSLTRVEANIGKYAVRQR